MESDYKFKVYFNQRRQWFEVHLHDVDPRKFYRYAKTYWGFYWGYNPAKKRNILKGFFGEIHLVASRVTVNLVQHELYHLHTDWCRVRRLDMNNPDREEDNAEISGELNANFWRAYLRHNKKRASRLFGELTRNTLKALIK